MKLLIPPDPLHGVDTVTPELRELHHDWIWKWKPWLRHSIDDGFDCKTAYGSTPADVMDPHAYDLVDYYHSREVRLGSIPREYWE